MTVEKSPNYEVIPKIHQKIVQLDINSPEKLEKIASLKKSGENPWAK